jgi:hypothetical protein
MGVAPEAIAKEILFGYRLKNICSLLFFIVISYKKILFLFVSSSKRSMLLIKVALEATGGFLGNNHSLRSFLGLIIASTLLDIRDIIDGVILCDDLTRR